MKYVIPVNLFHTLLLLDLFDVTQGTQKLHTLVVCGGRANQKKEELKLRCCTETLISSSFSERDACDSFLCLPDVGAAFLAAVMKAWCRHTFLAVRLSVLHVEEAVSKGFPTGSAHKAGGVPCLP